jgi:hypothetical protein
VPLPTQNLIPRAVTDAVAYAQNLINQLPPNTPLPQFVQDALDVANAAVEQVRYLTELTVDADAIIRTEADPNNGDLRASAFAWADVGHQNVLEANAEAAYEAGNYVLRANLHVKGVDPIDIQEFSQNPLKRDEKLAYDETLWSTSVLGISLAAVIHVRGDLQVDITPNEARVDVHGNAYLEVLIDGMSISVADDEVHASASAIAGMNQWFGDYACGKWNLDQQLEVMGQYPRGAQFNLGDVQCDGEAPIWVWQ